MRKEVFEVVETEGKAREVRASNSGTTVESVRKLRNFARVVYTEPAS